MPLHVLNLKRYWLQESKAIPRLVKISSVHFLAPYQREEKSFLHFLVRKVYILIWNLPGFPFFFLNFTSRFIFANFVYIFWQISCVTEIVVKCSDSNCKQPQKYWKLNLTTRKLLLLLVQSWKNSFEMASRSTLRNTDPKKVSGELFALTYGGLVSTLLKDYENVDDVNKQVGVPPYPRY